MGTRYISQFSASATELTLGQGIMASHQDDLLGKISEMEKSAGKISEMEKSAGKILEMGKTLGQLLDLSKSIMQELRLLRPPCTVIENYNPSHPNPEAYDLYPSLPEDWEPSLMAVNQGESRSVCLFVSSYEDEEHTNAVYEVKFKHGGEVTHEPPVVRHVAKFHGGCRQVARIFNHSKLYCIGKDGGFILDTKTWSNCSSIPPILASKSIETIVCAYDKVYYLACPSSLFSPVMGHSFGRYDSDRKVWEKMTSFPFYDDYDYRMQITGYAVCYGVILISLCGLRNGNFGVVAFHVGRKDWNRVKLDTSVYCAPPFQGRAVVVGDTIYALYGEAKIIAFSFSMGKGDYGGIAYSLSQLFISQGLEFARPDLPWFNDITQYLVHLGNHDFFHVQTGWCDSRLKVQYLTITTFRIVVGEGGRCMMKTIHSSVHSVDIKGSEWFELLFCFTPEFGDYEPIKEESVTNMNEPKQEEITARKLEIEAMQHDEANDVPIAVTWFYFALYGEAKIIAFSFSIDKDNDDCIAYSLSKMFTLHGLEFARPVLPWFDDLTQYLVHLKNHDFFHVRIGWCDSYLKVQYLSITTFQIVVGEGGRHMIKTIHSSVHSVDIKGSEWFDLVFCFTPEYGDYEPIEGKSVISMNTPKQEERNARKLEIEAVEHEEANDVPIGY